MTTPISTPNARAFDRLSSAEQALVRGAQKQRRQAKQQAKQAKRLARLQSDKQHVKVPAGDLLSAGPTYPTRISMDS